MNVDVALFAQRLAAYAHAMDKSSGLACVVGQLVGAYQTKVMTRITMSSVPEMPNNILFSFCSYCCRGFLFAGALGFARRAKW